MFFSSLHGHILEKAVLVALPSLVFNSATIGCIMTFSLFFREILGKTDKN